MINKTVVVVGCGPVGMFASHLLSRLNIDFLTLQKHSSARAHPSAHWISGSSKLLMKQIPGLTQAINNKQENWEYFQYYRFTEGLFGYELGNKNHFIQGINQKLEKCQKLTGSRPSHIPQNYLLSIMHEHMKQSDRLQCIKFGQSIQTIQKDQTGYIIYDSYKKPVAHSKYVLLCDGANSLLRDKYFHNKINKPLMDIINIHFQSKLLAKKITSEKRNSMLNFIYGQPLLGILVNHSIQEGIFVLQIPNFKPIIDISNIYSAREMIAMVFGTSAEQFDDLKIIHTGQWKLKAAMVNKMNQDGIILAGDSAHAYPPAGGFGMNSGFQDIHEAVHAINSLQRNPQLQKESILEQYSNRRLRINSKYLQKAMQNFEITKSISSSLGYPSSISEYFMSTWMNSIFSMVPSYLAPQLEQIRLRAMKILYKRPKQSNISFGLDLFFDDFDISIQKKSAIMPLIIAKNKEWISQNQKIKTLWVKNGVSMKQITQSYGKIQQENIHWFDQQTPFAEKIISSDGTVILN